MRCSWFAHPWLAKDRAHLSLTGQTLPKPPALPWETEPGPDSGPCCSFLGRQRCRPCYLPDKAIVAQGKKGFVRTAAEQPAVQWGPLCLRSRDVRRGPAEAPPPPRTNRDPEAQRGCGRPSNRPRFPPPQPFALKLEIHLTLRSPASKHRANSVVPLDWARGPRPIL